MSVFICELQGARGRSMKLYDNKCVITTDVTLGSVLTSNALDGMKTVFFADVVGVQYKQGGMTLGYLQLETPSSQMNNKSSNMFSENTFTFDANAAGNPGNSAMDLIHNFIVDRLEGYKYGGVKDITKEPPMGLIRALSDVGIYIGREIKQCVEDHNDAQLKKKAEAEAKLKAAEAQRSAELQKQLQDSPDENTLTTFIKAAAKTDSFAEMYKMWLSLDIEKSETTQQIEVELKRFASSERAYGKDSLGLQKYIEKLIMLIA